MRMTKLPEKLFSSDLMHFVAGVSDTRERRVGCGTGSAVVGELSHKLHYVLMEIFCSHFHQQPDERHAAAPAAATAT